MSTCPDCERLRAELSALRATDAAVISRLVGALDLLEQAAREVHRKGASPGAQWPKLSGALVRARQTLTDTAAQRQSVSPRPRRNASPSEVKTGRQGIGEE